MNSWAKSLDRHLKSSDSCLFVQEGKDGRYDVYRKNRDSMSLPHFIFSLTEDWSPQGRPVPWGIDVVLNRIRAHDLWRDDSFIENYIKECEKMSESKERARRNDVESFLYDYRRQFAKATSDINTGTMEKIYSPY